MERLFTDKFGNIVQDVMNEYMNTLLQPDTIFKIKQYIQYIYGARYDITVNFEINFENNMIEFVPCSLTDDELMYMSTDEVRQRLIEMKLEDRGW